MTAIEAFYCTVLYHAKNKTEGNELLHAICKCIVEDAERLKDTNLSFENGINVAMGKPITKVEVETTKPIVPETPDIPEPEHSADEELRVLPDELAI